MNVMPVKASTLVVGDDISYNRKIWEVIATDTKIVRLKRFKNVALREFKDKFEFLDGNLIVDKVYTGN